jgi:AraC-like DNA-binding protein/Tfp pilus assembly protein PilF
MKIRTLALLFATFVYSTYIGFSQDNIQDSLLNILANSSDVERIELLHKLTVANLAHQSENSVEYSTEAITLARHLGQDSLLSYSYYLTAIAYYYQEYWSLSTENYLEAIESKWGKSNDTFLSRCYSNLGICYEYLGEYDKTASAYFKSITLSESLGDTLMTARTELNLGMLHIRLKEFTRARENLQRSLRQLELLSDYPNLINVHQNLMIAEGRLNNLDLAEHHYRKAITLADSLELPAKIVDVESDFGSLLNELGKYELASIHFENSLEYLDSNATPHNYYHSIFLRGKNAIYTGDYVAAEELLLLAHEKLTALEVKVWHTNLLLNLSRLYARTGDHDKADEYQMMALEHEQNLFQESRSKSISEMEVKYETEKKEQDLAFHKLLVKTQNRKIIFALVVALLFALAFLLVLILVRRTKVSNRELFERNKELTARWDQLNAKPISDSDGGENQLYNSISELMNTERLFENQELNVELISKKLNSNTKYVSQAIKDRTGLNFNTYINTHRIEEAKRILQDPVKSAWSLDAVAFSSGFNNSSTFYQSFKKLTGLTPSVFRNIQIS